MSVLKVFQVFGLLWKTPMVFVALVVRLSLQHMEDCKPVASQVKRKGECMQIDLSIKSLSNLWTAIGDPDSVCGISC